jgi:hypothetical protein
MGVVPLAGTKRAKLMTWKQRLGHEATDVRKHFSRHLSSVAAFAVLLSVCPARGQEASSQAPDTPGHPTIWGSFAGNIGAPCDIKDSHSTTAACRRAIQSDRIYLRSHEPGGRDYKFIRQDLNKRMRALKETTRPHADRGSYLYSPFADPSPPVPTAGAS